MLYSLTCCSCLANTRIQNEHSFSILMLEARKFDQKIRPESENRNATMAGHLAWQWAGHGQQWPAMAGHGWSCLDNGQSMVSQGPSAQAHGNVWHCVPVFGPESCTLHQAAIPTPGPKPKIQNQSFQNKIPKLRNCESKGIQNTTPKPKTLSHRFQTDATQNS